MTTQRSNRAGTDRTPADTGSAGATEGGPEVARDAQPAKSDMIARARERADQAQSIQVPVRHAARRVTARARRLTGYAAAWARQNPKAASAVAGAAVTGLAAWRRTTRRGQRRQTRV